MVSLTEAPSVSSKPTVSPAPTALDAILSPSTAPTSGGIPVGPSVVVNFTIMEAGELKCHLRRLGERRIAVF